MQNQRVLIYRTANDIGIYSAPGTKQPREQYPYDFIVKYRQPGLRLRTPKHIHIIADLYQKRALEPNLTNDFVDHIINQVIYPVQPIDYFPPELQVFRPAHIAQFEGLHGISEYSPEFLLVAIELIMIQERTNYPDGVLNLNLFQAFRNNADIYSVVSAATFRGR